MYNSVLCYLENTVNQYRDKIALCDKTQKITFYQWKQNALCIAEEIKRRKQEQHIPVLVYLPKGVSVLVSFAGVLYAGNFYTPTDVKFPFKKVQGILDCLQPQLYISDTSNSKTLVENGISTDDIINIDELDFGDKERDSAEYLCRIADTDLAYVFFTSGSTGVPKGVAIRQRSIIDYIDWASDKFNITEKEVIANQAPFYFDNSILDIYLCMRNGCELHIIPEMTFAFPANLLKYIIDHQINFIFWVPSALIQVANSGLLERLDCSCLKKILFCGEVMPNKHLNIWRRNLPNVLYANLYGPTEITDVCSYYIVDREFEDDAPLPIGKACENTEIILLSDSNERIREAGLMGELCVRGTCLAVGYYNNPEKTQEVFVQNPLNYVYEEKIYRTGDLAHYNEFGEIMFDGRKDFQIKHLGNRIELGEIETAILSLDEIETACCIYDTENTQIVAFISGKDDISDVEVRKKLMKILPKYMVPTRYITLDSLPLNDNGKINRKQLKAEYID